VLVCSCTSCGQTSVLLQVCLAVLPETQLADFTLPEVEHAIMHHWHANKQAALCMSWVAMPHQHSHIHTPNTCNAHQTKLVPTRTAVWVDLCVAVMAVNTGRLPEVPDDIPQPLAQLIQVCTNDSTCW
jgi:hypothetical protein